MGDLSAVTGYYNAAVRILMPLLAVGLLLCSGRMPFRQWGNPRLLPRFFLRRTTRRPLWPMKTPTTRNINLRAHRPTSQHR